MKKSFHHEAASLRVLSSFYRNDMALFSRYANERFLLDVPDYEPGEQTPLSVRGIRLFNEPSVKYAVRKASAPVISRCDSICSILMDYTLDIYRKEIPDSQQKLQLLICWLNVAEDEESPEWRISLFRISDANAEVGKATDTSGTFTLPAMRRDALVREPRLSYSAGRKNLIRIKDKEHTIHFLEKDDIIWAESDHLHSIIHTHGGTIRANTTLSQLAGDALSWLYRPHISYLINPRYLYQLNNTHLILTDGTIIPIPERRLTKVKKDLCAAY